MVFMQENLEKTVADSATTQRVFPGFYDNGTTILYLDPDGKVTYPNGNITTDEQARAIAELTLIRDPESYIRLKEDRLEMEKNFVKKKQRELGNTGF
jgi:hypothetical protein